MSFPDSEGPAHASSSRYRSVSTKHLQSYLDESPSATRTETLLVERPQDPKTAVDVAGEDQALVRPDSPD